MPRFVLYFAALLLAVLCTTARADERPNIVLILCDDMGYSDIGCYGGEIETPNLDRLARGGLQMTQFYNNAKCTETRAALLSGLYHHQTNNLKKANHVTLAEALGAAGYTTLMSGKWHVGRFNSGEGTPTQRGFDRYFGFLGGAINFFTGRDFGSGRNLMRLDDEVYETPDGFYSTDAFTDFAIQFVDEAVEADSPFFLYLAHNAPHFPLHAPAETIEKYRGKYAEGWDKLRQNRYKSMVNRGLIDPKWELSPRDPLAPAWDSLSEERQAEEQQLMEVYAAMIDRLDAQIGRLLDHLDELGVAENTLVVFLSDNGGCPFDFNHTPNRPAGPAESRRTYDTEWANASNTPFRFYKQWSHEGGISTPMLIRWPKKIEPARRSKAPAHLIDIMPTFLKAAGAEYPEQFDGREAPPMEGRSLMPILAGQDDWSRGPMFWDFRGSRAVRDGRWKLVAERGKPWELYDLENDRTELHDLAKEHPTRVKEMAAAYDAWAQRVGARTNQQATRMRPNSQDRYLTQEEKQSGRSRK